MMATDAAGSEECLAFSAMRNRLPAQLLKALEAMEMTHATPVQTKVLQLPRYTQDCLVQAKTGTGKTIAFLLPALHTLLSSRKGPNDQDGGFVKILVLAPTRELAQQIGDQCDKLTALCNPRIECHIAVGGSNKKAALSRFLKGNPSVLVATPGRLLDYLSEAGPRERLGRIQTLVLDEADRMLDQGFMPDLLRILDNIPPKAQAGWQGMCFSATLPPEIDRVLHNVLNKDHVRLSTTDENEAPTVEAIPQWVYPVQEMDEVLPTLHKVLSAAKDDAKGKLKAVVFCSTARQAALCYHVFGPTGRAAPPNLPIFQMHSRMSQTQRTRTVEEFKAADKGIMFASDVVGRGMDFPDIGLVIQVGAPAEKEQYVHRVGRTGRAGKVGRAVMILTPEEMTFVKSNPDFPIQNDGPFTHPTALRWPSEQIIQDALAKVPEETRAVAYSAFLGFHKSLMKRYRLDAAGLVEWANRYAESIGFVEPPELEAKLVGKMGLKGVPGLHIAGKGLVTANSARGNPATNSQPRKNPPRPWMGRGNRRLANAAKRGESQAEPRAKRARRED